jgi:hypothetical protein
MYPEKRSCILMRRSVCCAVSKKVTVLFPRAALCFPALLNNTATFLSPRFNYANCRFDHNCRSSVIVFLKSLLSPAPEPTIVKYLIMQLGSIIKCCVYCKDKRVELCVFSVFLIMCSCVVCYTFCHL